MAKKKKLTDKQKMFVKEYIVDFNATQAAIRAGYSKKTAKEIGYELLTKLHIQEAIAKELEKREERVELNQDFIVHKLMRGVLVEGQEIEVENGAVVFVNSKGYYKALELLGSHLGMFKKVHAGDKDNPLFPAIKITRPDDK